jgi:hypothetical protein
MRRSAYVVFWLQRTFNEELEAHVIEPHHNEFETIDEVLMLTESLRTRQRAGEPISHVVFAIEDPESVGHPGVDVTGPDYDWKKRRT